MPEHARDILYAFPFRDPLRPKPQFWAWGSKSFEKSKPFSGCCFFGSIVLLQVVLAKYKLWDQHTNQYEMQTDGSWIQLQRESKRMDRHSFLTNYVKKLCQSFAWYIYSLLTNNKGKPQIEIKNGDLRVIA